ncbi:MAG: spheroidene monooxygenase [Pseudomonadota bacterium]
MQTVSLSFFRFSPGLARIWAFAMMGLARPAMRKVPGIGFWKLCGSGTGEGFTPIPNTGVYAILATWPDYETARIATETAKIFKRYKARATEAYTVFLNPVSVRGEWSGVRPFERSDNPGHGPVAALTRATVKPKRALLFWSRVPDISDMIGEDPNVAFKIGIGEVPLLHQVTFSIWPDTQGMARFARADGPHARAIKAVREGDWFREELYARFNVRGDRGTWEGKRPLDRLGVNQ